MPPAKDIPRLETDRLVLTLPGPDFAPRMLAYVQDNRDHLAPWNPIPPSEYYGLAYWRTQLGRNREELFADQSCRFVITMRDDDCAPVVGQCNFGTIVRGAFHACILGYHLGAMYQGHGLMCEALRAGIGYMFDELKMHRIMANYMPRNERSAKVLGRLGFVKEGEAKDYLFIAGKWEDHILTALTNPNLPAPVQ